MRLKKDFIIHDVGSEHLLVPSGGNAFKGLLKNNDTAAFIIGELKKDTTEDGIIDALCGEYDVERDTAAGDIRRVLDKLREIGALEG